VSETDLVSTEAASAPRKRGGLTGMVLAELRQLAGELNIPNISGMRKGDLIAAIREKQGTAPSRKQAAADQPTLPENGSGPTDSSAAGTGTAAAATTEPAATSGNGAAPAPAAAPTRRRRAASRPAGARTVRPTGDGAGPSDAAPAPAEAASQADSGKADTKADVAKADTTAGAAKGDSDVDSAKADSAKVDSAPQGAPATEGAAAQTAQAPAEAPAAAADAGTDTAPPSRRSRQSRRNRAAQEQAERAEQTGNAPAADSPAEERPRERGRDGGREGGDMRPDRREDGRGDRDGRDGRDGGRGGRPDNRGDNRTDTRGPRDNRPDDDGDDDVETRGRRGRRFRDRRRGRDRDRGQGGQGNVDTEVRDGDVLLPVAGIVDILDNYAFVRTTGYLSGPTDVYVSLSMVRKYGLRRGDAITGAVREPREGEQSRQKFNPLVRVDSINGQDPETAKSRPEFMKLTPLYPNERLRLETEPHKLTTRVIDLVMPVGKGQRALIVSPPKAGKTTIMQNIANAITSNNPECHLMVVLVDERPEEVTDMQRSVKGEVIASTFDRPPTDHTTVAELSIERAKRLVEMGHDVVVLLDNITRLGRAYNLAAPASGRILSGGVDSTALYPPKRFLGAARNIEDGGSLTIFATALVETGSTMDTVIFEEFKGTGNAELRLDRKIADKRVFPAIDVGDSGTRKEELLMSPDEHAVMVKLRRVLAALDDQQAIDLLLTQLRKTRTNIEFMMQVAKNTPGSED
jgi:transcription termination factor Rho